MVTKLIEQRNWQIPQLALHDFLEFGAEATKRTFE